MAVLLLFYSFYRLPETFHLGNTLTKAPFWSVAKRLSFDSKVWCYGLLIGALMVYCLATMQKLRLFSSITLALAVSNMAFLV